MSPKLHNDRDLVLVEVPIDCVGSCITGPGGSLLRACEAECQALMFFSGVDLRKGLGGKFWF